MPVALKPAQLLQNASFLKTKIGLERFVKKSFPKKNDATNNKFRDLTSSTCDLVDDW